MNSRISSAMMWSLSSHVRYGNGLRVCSKRVSSPACHICTLGRHKKIMTPGLCGSPPMWYIVGWNSGICESTAITF